MSTVYTPTTQLVEDRYWLATVDEEGVRLRAGEESAREGFRAWLAEHDAQVRAEALRGFADEYERIHARVEPTGETPDYWRGAEDAHEYIVGRLRSASDFQLHGHEGTTNDN